MDYSLNEFEQLVLKAARGAGLFWGHAEEASIAARILSEFDIDHGAMILLAFDEFNCSNALWKGASFCDEFKLSRKKFFIDQVKQPALLIPFVFLIASRHAKFLKICWNDFEAVVAKDQLFVKNELAIFSKFEPLVTISECIVKEGRALQRIKRARIKPDVYSNLNDLANRTHAPSSTNSRLAGAGAGLKDND